MSYQSDEEQVELLKNLWKDYGQPVILGIALTLAAVSGYQYWQKTQQQEVASASMLYQNLLGAVDPVLSGRSAMTAEQRATMEHVVATLQKDHADSQYATFATLFQAQQQVLANELAAARTSLEWVLAHKPSPEMQIMATARLGRVLLSESVDNSQQVLDSLNALPASNAYLTTVEAVKGDAYLALGDRQQARAAYRKAIDAAQANGMSRPILQLKLDDLAALDSAEQSPTQEG